MTSNLGSDIIQDKLGRTDQANLEGTMEEASREVFSLLKQHMRPEFLNRIDELVMFRPLSREDLEDIIRIQLSRLGNTLEKQGISLEPAQNLIAYLKEEGYDLQFGARPLKRLIQKKVVDGLSMAILQGKVQQGSHLEISVEDGKVVFQSRLKQKDEGEIPTRRLSSSVPSGA
jgi:ATP-dependent Clp protease ATP-binding subunit ClpB